MNLGGYFPLPRTSNRWAIPSPQPMKFAKLSRISGFTLIEVMMAATILLLGIVGMMHAITSGTEMLDTSRKQTLAGQIIQNEIERVRLLKWSEVSSLSANPTTVTLAGVFIAQDKSFSCERTVADVKNDLRKLTFTVTWKSNTHRVHTRTGETYIGKNGLSVTYQRS